MKTRKNRYQLREQRAQLLAKKMSGKGVYIFQNNTNGSLMLPKKALDGKKEVGPGETFQGDDYFFQLLKSHEVSLVEVISKGDEHVEKLILDQPNTVTEKGTVEHVVEDEKKKKLNEVPQDETQKDILINEDPLDGVEILLD